VTAAFMGWGGTDVARLLEAVTASKTLASRAEALVSPNGPLLMPTRASISYPKEKFKQLASS